jgi:hypothetical protein
MPGVARAVGPLDETEQPCRDRHRRVGVPSKSGRARIEGLLRGYAAPNCLEPTQ